MRRNCIAVAQQGMKVLCELREAAHELISEDGPWHRLSLHPEIVHLDLNASRHACNSAEPILHISLDFLSLAY